MSRFRQLQPFVKKGDLMDSNTPRLSPSFFSFLRFLFASLPENFKGKDRLQIAIILFIALFLASSGEAQYKATAVTGGLAHTCAITDEGVALCWGRGNHCQLGWGLPADADIPVGVVGLIGGAAGISAGKEHTCGLTNSGGVKCWGLNGWGELGDGTIESRCSPVDVVGLTSGVKAVSAGGRHTCALTDSGGVKCWGYNWYGQLGNGTTSAGQTTPVDVFGLTSGVKAISAGGYHTCALMNDGSVRCWGKNDSGQIGDGTPVDRHYPVDVVGLNGAVIALAAGGAHTCGIISGGTVKCWGNNEKGQIGDGKTDNRFAPVYVLGLVYNVVISIGSGGNHTCAVMDGNYAKCWGDGNYGQLGTGEWGVVYMEPVILETLGCVSSLAGGWEHTCARMTDRTLRCWGRNLYGQIGNNSSGVIEPLPVSVFDFQGGTNTIGGMIRDGDSGLYLDAVEVSDNAGHTTLSKEGFYFFCGLPDGTYTITPSKTCYNFLPASETLTITSKPGNYILHFTGYSWPITIAGMIRDGNSGLYLDAVEVSVNTGHTTLSKKGFYFFCGLPESLLTITPSKTGYYFLPASETIDGTSYPKNYILHFTGYPITYAVGGKVTNNIGNPVSETTINAGPGIDATTDSKGDYTLGLGTGPYTLTPAKTGYTFSPPTRIIQVTGNMIGQDFIALAPGDFLKMFLPLTIR